MELITYTKDEVKFYSGKPTVRITAKHGSISFSRLFIEKAGFSPGDKLAFHQDKARPKDWYVSKTDNPRGLRLRLQANRQLVCTNKGLVIKILDSLNKPGESAGFRMATEPTEGKYFAIITAEGI